MKSAESDRKMDYWDVNLEYFAWPHVLTVGVEHVNKSVRGVFLDNPNTEQRYLIKGLELKAIVDVIANGEYFFPALDDDKEETQSMSV